MNHLGPLTSSKVIFSELMVNVVCGQVIKSQCLQSSPLISLSH